MKRRIRIRKKAEGLLLPPLLPRGKRERRRVELLSGVAVSVFSLLIVCVFVLSSAHRFLLRSPQAAAVVSAILVDLANDDRVSNDLAILKTNPVLVAAAQAKANDMAVRGYFAHVSPEGVDPWHWFKEAGYSFEYAGENLAIDFADSADVERAWMNSPTHRENILNEHYTEIGIATAQGTYEGRPTTFVVQEFGAPSARVQEAIHEETVPAEPTELAVAGATAAGADTQVLGSTQEKSPVTTEPALAASLSKEVGGNVPWWGYVLGFPRDAMRYAYYLIGLFVLLALALETGFEMRWHHARRALAAGTLLATMSVFFIVADYLFFAQPVLAALGS